MEFRAAVEATSGLEDAWCSGMQALRARDRKHVEAESARALAGSVNVDSALKKHYPNDRRWDYAIGHQDEFVFWIEVHPASQGEVNVVLAKLQWLKGWLRGDAKELNGIRREFIWISSGKTSFTLTSPQQKRFALLGLQHKGRVFKIPEKAPPT